MFDPYSREFSQDPYAVYQRLRDTDGAYYFEAVDMWLLSRYEDISAVTIDPNMVRSLVGHCPVAELRQRQRQANWHDMPYHERVVQFSLLDSDGPVHRRLRKQVFGALTGSAIAGLEPVVQQFVDQLLDNLQDRDEIDFVEDFAAQVPGFVIGHLLGAPAEDCLQLRRWSETIVRFFDIDRSHERKMAAETATREFYEYLSYLKHARMKAPKDDLISKMIVDAAAGHYSGDEFISTCMLILMAGHGSTIDVLGSGMHTLLKHPEVLQKLRQDPELWPNAIQEMFRYEPPLPFFHRHVTVDTTINGQLFRKGTTLGLLYGSANRDPAQYEAPDEFRIDRQPNRHLAFGRGAHLCLGNHLARMNMKVIFTTLLRRFSSIELVDEQVIYKPGLSVRGPVKLNISWQLN